MNAAASENGCCAPLAIEGGERFSILTWNIDGLRAFLADAARAAALEELLRARSPLMLCLLEHKLQAQGASSDEARAGLEKLADDLGYNELNFMNNTRGIRTPNLDELANDGVILKNSYVNPICSPTRGSLMTGRYTINIGLQSNVIYWEK